MNLDIPQFVPSEVCLKCDGCCRFKDEHSPWRPKLADEEAQLLKSDVDLIGYLKTVTTAGQCHCTFFNLQDQTCKIYGHRPFECLLYPFLMIKKQDQTLIGIHLSCPYVQKMHDTLELKEFTQKLKDFFARKDVMEFIQRNPTLAHDYQEYQDEIRILFRILAD